MIAKVITNIAQVVHLAEEHCRGDWLYRGQSTTNPPIPKAFRPATIRSIDVGAIKCGFEAMVGHEFRDYAHSVHSSCPEDKSWYEWLALMQHYGAATRLLDWSRSLLAAAFFAVEHSDKNDAYDGEIWVLNSGALTEFTRIAHDPKQTTNFSCSYLDGARGSPGIEFSINKAVDRLAEQAFADDRFRKEKECRFQHTCRYPLASAPPRKFARLAAQRGWFTIHPVTPDVPLAGPAWRFSSRRPSAACINAHFGRPRSTSTSNI
ncbi:MAG: FRG domain-containing protein [Planctomycetes bacterium]|nr:FRG domain-containing protein [Planctomycetota bacterium]